MIDAGANSRTAPNTVAMTSGSARNRPPPYAGPAETRNEAVVCRIMWMIGAQERRPPAATLNNSIP